MGDIFKAIFGGNKAMRNRTDAVRKALLDGASPHRIAHVAVARAQRDHPATWLSAAIAQLGQILSIPPVEARMWVSEHCEVRTK